MEETAYIEEINGEFFAFKVEKLGMGSDMDALAKHLMKQGYNVRIGGNLSQFK